MTNSQKIKYIKKAIKLNIIKTETSAPLDNRGMNELIAEAMLDESANAAIRRIAAKFISPMVGYESHTNITIGTTDDKGISQVSFKQPVIRKASVTDEVTKSDGVETPLTEEESAEVDTNIVEESTTTEDVNKDFND